MKSIVALGLYLFVAVFVPQAYAERYLSQEEFLQQAFAGAEYSSHKLWMNEDIKQAAQSILKHDYNALRIRYWGAGNTTAWVLDEIGKERPITIGVVVKNGEIERVRILEFRESRGWEVRYPFFTDQFKGVTLTEDKGLSKTIDGVSGATLSVRAVKKIAAFALYLHSLTNYAQ